MRFLVMRFFFIIAGSALLEAFHWIIFIFGGILILTAIKLAREEEPEVDPEPPPAPPGIGAVTRTSEAALGQTR